MYITMSQHPLLILEFFGATLPIINQTMGITKNCQYLQHLRWDWSIVHESSKHDQPCLRSPRWPDDTFSEVRCGASTMPADLLGAFESRLDMRSRAVPKSLEFNLPNFVKSAKMMKASAPFWLCVNCRVAFHPQTLWMAMEKLLAPQPITAGFGFHRHP